MKNAIVINLEELEKQQDAITNSNIDENNKEALLNLTSLILDMAVDHSQEKEVTLVMLIK